MRADSRRVDYEPGESTTGLFGGNSNWRGPVWFPVNYLVIEALRRFRPLLRRRLHRRAPHGLRARLRWTEIADDLSAGWSPLPRRGDGRRPVFGGTSPDRPGLAGLILFFHEYFHGDSGAGLGASHQTGWTGLVSRPLSPAGIQ